MTKKNKVNLSRKKEKKLLLNGGRPTKLPVKSPKKESIQFFGQRLVDQYILNTFFKDHKGGFFVECGALDGKLESTCLVFEKYFNWHGINIEPVPSHYNKLITNRPKSINIQCALSDHEGQESFIQVIHPSRGNNFGHGSLSHTQQHHDQLIQMNCTFEKIDVICRKFSTIAKELSIPQIDLFVLDIEGHELSALTGIMDIERELFPKVFCIEFPLVGLNNIINKLGMAYKFHSCYYNNAFFVLNRP